MEISTHLKLRVANATHNFKWVKIIWICQIPSPVFFNIVWETMFTFPGCILSADNEEKMCLVRPFFVWTLYNLSH